MGVMVNRRGLLDWMAQRVTAILIGLYTLFLLGFMIVHPSLSYMEWADLFNGTFMRIATVLALLSVLWHAWIGLWTVLTDYVKVKPMRLLIQTIIILLLVSFLVSLLDILWR